MREVVPGGGRLGRAGAARFGDDPALGDDPASDEARSAGRPAAPLPPAGDGGDGPEGGR